MAQQDQAWFLRAVQWHDLNAAVSFYQQWQAWQSGVQEEEATRLRDILHHWAASTTSGQKRQWELRFGAVFLKTGDKRRLSSNEKILRAWQDLGHSPFSVSRALPGFYWNGSQNQYHQWLTQILKGNLGVSLKDYQPVTKKIVEGLQVTAPIAVFGLVLAGLLSTALAFWLTLHPHSFSTILLRKILYLVDSIPTFLLCLVIFFFYLASGGTLSSPVLYSTQAFILPFFTHSTAWLAVICVSLLLLPYLTLQFYQHLDQESHTYYLRTARAKGLSPSHALYRHAVPNALLPILTIISETLVGLMAGILVVEVTFSLPGVGSLLTQAILSHDYPVVIGFTILLLAFRMVIVHLTDLLYLWVDPRLRLTAE
ncbi:MAG: ABC transporter permease [Rufibacter sp.]